MVTERGRRGGRGQEVRETARLRIVIEEEDERE